MAQPTFDQVWITDRPTRIKYVLPVRRIVGWPIGWFLTLFGATFIVVGFYAIYDTAIKQSIPDAIQYVVFIIAGLIIFLPARVWASTRSKILITRQTLRYSEHAWPLRWSWSRPIKAVRGFEASPADFVDAFIGFIIKNRLGADQRPLSADHPAAIRAECDGHPPLTIALAYPADLIDKLAPHMTRAIQTRGLTALTGDEHDAFDPNSPEPPPGSGITIDRTDDGLTIRVPALGLWRTAPVLAIFAVVFLFFSGVSTWAILAGANVEHPLAYGVVALFWAVGLGMLAGAIRVGKRPAVIDVIADHLVITQAVWKGVQQHEFTTDQVSAIEVSASATFGQTGDELVIGAHVDGNAKQLRLIGGRDHDQLLWLATTLRRALGMTSGESVESPTHLQGSGQS